jgi:hypothetical protein
MSNEQLERIKQEILRYRPEADGGMNLADMQEQVNAMFLLVKDPEVRTVLSKFGLIALRTYTESASILGSFFAPLMLMLLAGIRVNEPAQVER